MFVKNFLTFKKRLCELVTSIYQLFIDIFRENVLII